MLDKRLLVTGLSLLLVVSASALAAILPERGVVAAPEQLEQPIHTPPVTRALPPRPDPPVRDYLYIIKEFEGRVAVFGEDPDHPELILDTLVRHLPAYDREQLQEGIEVQTAEDLAARIEDYTS